MSFKSEGTIDVTITDAFISEAKFQPKDGELNNQGVPVETYYDVCIQVANAEGDSDLWRGEMSNRNGVGNSAHLYRADLTLKTLQEIGFNVQSMTELEAQFVPANDRSISIPNLIGIKCTVTVERREYTDKTGAQKSILFIKYLNALGSGGHAKRLSFDDFMARRRTQPQTPAAPPQYQQPVQTPYQVPAQPAPATQPLYNQVPVAAPQAPAAPSQAAAPVTPPSAPSVPVGAGPCPSVSVRAPAAAPAPAAPSPACPY